MENPPCNHRDAIRIQGYDAAQPDPDSVWITETLEYCPGCDSIRVWGVGWIEAPEPSEYMRTRLREAAENKCQCGAIMGEDINDRCQKCFELEDLKDLISKMSDAELETVGLRRIKPVSSREIH